MFNALDSVIHHVAFYLPATSLKCLQMVCTKWLFTIEDAVQGCTFLEDSVLADVVVRGSRVDCLLPRFRKTILGPGRMYRERDMRSCPALAPKIWGCNACFQKHVLRIGFGACSMNLSKLMEDIIWRRLQSEENIVKVTILLTIRLPQGLPVAVTEQEKRLGNAETSVPLLSARCDANMEGFTISLTRGSFRLRFLSKDQLGAAVFTRESESDADIVPGRWHNSAITFCFQRTSKRKSIVSRRGTIGLWIDGEKCAALANVPAPSFASPRLRKISRRSGLKEVQERQQIHSPVQTFVGADCLHGIRISQAESDEKLPSVFANMAIDSQKDTKGGQTSRRGIDEVIRSEAISLPPPA